jgi:hypothetical protein
MARTAARPAKLNPTRNIVPDRLDLRDRPYMPAVATPPDVEMAPHLKLPVLQQGATNACTGFALASVVNFLLRKHRDSQMPPMSPFMLYSMARRYDEFPGSSDDDSGSSLRGAMKGWYKHRSNRQTPWHEQQIFPIFLMWETDLWSTLKNRLEDLVTGLPKPTGGMIDQLKRFWNQRLERLLAPPGTAIWGEMKQNADGISKFKDSGGLVLYESGMKSPWFTQTPYRLHLIGHSAGAILHCHVVARLAELNWKFESVNFMAPAATVDLFKETLLPRIKDKTVKQFRSFHLNDAAEQQDPTCKPVLGYGRSLLYLVSESFEGGVRTPLLGMEKYFDAEVAPLKLPNVKTWVAPGPATASTTHGGFDDDKRTMESIINLIKGRKP